MISYHPNAQIYKENCVSEGWKHTDIMDFKRIANGICRFPWSPIHWNEGKRRAEHFKRSVFCVLDFDEGVELAQGIKNFSDCQHIIGTTRNHRKEKNGKPPCDRFRVIIPWRRPIDDVREFVHNMALVIDKYGADKNAQGGSRFFHPCTEVVSIQEPDVDLFTMEVEELPEKQDELVGMDYKNYLEMVTHLFKMTPTYPKKYGGFIKNGTTFTQSREVCCFWSAKWLLERGTSALDVIEILRKSPFDRTDFGDEEIRHAVQTAVNYVKERLNGKK